MRNLVWKRHAAFSDLVFVHSVVYHSEGQDRKPYVELNGTNRRRRNKILKVLIRDGFRCKSCGARHDLTMDHVKPKALGGNDDKKNLQTLCWNCNQDKDDNYGVEECNV